MKRLDKHYFFSVTVMFASLASFGSIAKATSFETLDSTNVDEIMQNLTLLDTTKETASSADTIVTSELVSEQQEDAQKQLNTQLFKACYKGNVEAAHELLSSNSVSIHAKGVFGYTPLHIACQYNYFDLVTELLKWDPKINDLNDVNYTPLFIASEKGFDSIVDLLLTAGADTEIADDDGVRPLHMAALKGHFDVVEKLINNSAIIDAQTKKGATALHVASQFDYVDIAKLLIEKGADLLKKDITGYTPLMAICYSKNEKLWFLAINANVSPEIRRSFEPDFTILMLNGSKNIDIIKSLVDKGMDINININIKFNYKWSLLHYACLYGLLDLAEYLVKRGADLAAVNDDDNKTPFQYLNPHQQIYMFYVTRELDISIPDTFLSQYNVVNLYKTMIKDAESSWRQGQDNTIEPQPTYVPTAKVKKDFIDAVMTRSIPKGGLEVLCMAEFLKGLKIFDYELLAHLDIQKNAAIDVINKANEDEAEQQDVG